MPNPAVYSTVTDQRLEHPDVPPADWLMYRRTYDGSGLQPAESKSRPSNIRRLTLAWSVSTDLLGAH